MEKIIVGKITNTHGINGELKIQKTGDEIFRKNIYYYIGNQNVKVSVERVKNLGGIVIVKFNEFNDINDVLGFKTEFVYIDKEDLLYLEDYTYYINDLIGMEVYDENKNYIGILSDVLTYSANDVYVIKSDNREILLPAVKSFVLDVNIKEKRMVVKLIEGM